MESMPSSYKEELRVDNDYLGEAVGRPRQRFRHIINA